MEPTDSKQRDGARSEGDRRARASTRFADPGRLYRLLADNSREVVTCHAPDLTILYASPSAGRTLGYEAASLLGHRLDDYAHPDDLATLLSAFAVAHDSGDESSAVFRWRDGDGDWRWCEVFCRGVRPSGAALGEIHATIRDVTRYRRIEKAIERVAQEWRSTFDAANDGVVMLDAEGRIMRVNRSTLDLFGCDFQDLIGESLLESTRSLLGLEDPFGLERVWHDGSRVKRDWPVSERGVWLRSTVDPVAHPGETGIGGAVVFIADITNEKNAELQLRASLEEVRKLSSHLQEVREEERRTIAREVHDELGHSLTALKMDIAWLVKHISADDTELQQRGEELRGLADQTITAARRIVSQLRPPVLDDLGLDAALEWLCNDFQRYSGLTAELSITDLPPRLRGENASAIFRIVQEALTNVSRHADASRVDVTLAPDEAGYRLAIADDGSGFSTDDVRGVAGFGLLGISERVRDLGGEIRVDSRPGQGTRLAIDLPASALA